MKISTRGEYGIRAMIELTHRYGEGYVQSTVIAGERAFRRISYSSSSRCEGRPDPQPGGPQAATCWRGRGGYLMAEVISALEGPIEPVSASKRTWWGRSAPFGNE
jgi:hypothetical protein